MRTADDPGHEHQVGITNSQEDNPDPVIADLTKRMNELFEEKRHQEAVCAAFQMTAKSKEELRQDFQKHGVAVLHIDHEVFGIYRGQLEPSYDVQVEGRAEDVLAAAKEFGKRHAQEMVLIARKVKEGEYDPSERMGLTILLNEEIRIEIAVKIAELVRASGFQGATFTPGKNGAICIFHTENFNISAQEFEHNTYLLLDELRKSYKYLQYEVAKYIISTPNL